MGVQGLRKFIDSSSCTSVLPTPADAVPGTGSSDGAAASSSKGEAAPALVDHLLFDMNGLIHSCYSREHTSSVETIRATLQRLALILRRVVTPLMTLTLAVDGPPPVAKLLTQRLRRRRLRHMDVQSGSGFSDLSITVGSVFLLELEQALGRFLIAAKAEGWLRCRSACVVGSSVIGEGEHKIARALQLIAHEPELYRADSTVVVVGNDIDLVLTCMGAVSFINLAVLSPSSLQLIDVSAILKRWATGDGAFVKNLPELAAARLDFVFLFLLNGGDHFVGLGDAASALWTRYKTLKKVNPNFRVFNPTGSKLSVSDFAELIGCDTTRTVIEEADADGAGADDDDAEVEDDEFGGRGGADKGKGKSKGKGKGAKAVPMSNRDKELMELARALFDAAMSDFAATVRGDTHDYRVAPPDTSGVSLLNLREAVLRLPAQHMTFRRSANPPLPPLLGYVAVMPTSDHYPGAVRRAAQRYPQIVADLEKANDAAAIIKAAEALWRRVDVAALTPAERFLTQFGDPVAIELPGRAGEAPLPNVAARWKAPLLGGSKHDTTDSSRARLPFDAHTPLVFREPLGRKAKTHLWKPLSETSSEQQPTQPQVVPAGGDNTRPWMNARAGDAAAGHRRSRSTNSADRAPTRRQPAPHGASRR